jgi:hypothetical protein
MRDLRTERDALRSALPASQVPALDRRESSDDPEDLLEQADVLRDSEDKVRQRLLALRGRITEVREERELDRRMSDFLGEESMFDEQDRRMRLRLGSDRRLQVDRSERRGGGLFSPQEDTVADGPPPAVGGVEGTPSPLPGAGQDDETPVVPPPTLPTARASDRRPQVDSVRAQDLAAGGPVDLAALEAEAAKLEALARELDGRASAMERRARELEAP